MEIVPTPSLYPDLTDRDRANLIDSLVIPPLLKAGREVLHVEDLPGYRSYSLQPPNPKDQQVYDSLAKAAKLLQNGYRRFAQSYIAEHPEILSHDLKVHLQPQPADIPQAVSSLVTLLSEESEVADKISGFKVNTRGVYLKAESSQPYIVIYLQKGASLEEMAPVLVKKFADFKPTNTPPLFNQKLGPIVYASTGDGYFKQMYLSRFDLLGLYYNLETNFSTPRVDLPKPKESAPERILRKAVERIIR